MFEITSVRILEDDTLRCDMVDIKYRMDSDPLHSSDAQQRNAASKARLTRTLWSTLYAEDADIERDIGEANDNSRNRER